MKKTKILTYQLLSYIYHSNFVLYKNSVDRWVSLLNSAKTYCVTGAYDYLISMDNNDTYGNKDVWLKVVPLKVNLFVWRMLLNRISTKDNLFQRHVIPLDDCYCIGGCGVVEDRNHLFV